MRRSVALVLFFFCLFGVANAAEVDSEGGGDVVFEADPGEANRVRVTSTDEGGHVVVDEGAPLDALGTCTSLDEHRAECHYDTSCGDPRACDYQSTFQLNDGSDRIRFGGFSGGKVYGGSGRDRVVSDQGNLDVDAGGGNDVVLGSPEFDMLDGGPGADVLDGRGGDSDVALYYSRSRAVTVTLDGRANDGAPGEADLVKTEWVYGGSGADTLVGGDDGNVLSGWDGDDELIGGGGRDVVDGLSGDDTLFGGHDDDAVLGGIGNDELYGGAGPDELDGSNGADKFWGGPGDDRIMSFDQNPDPPDPMPDRIHCGSGEDTVYMGFEDHAGRGCETVLRGTPRA